MKGHVPSSVATAGPRGVRDPHRRPPHDAATKLPTADTRCPAAAFAALKGHPTPAKGTAKGHVDGPRGVRDAQRRLAAILRAARKLSVTSDDLARLPAARRLAAGGCSGGGGDGDGGGGRHVLPLVASVVAVAAALLLFLCAGDGQPLARLRNASDPVPATPAVLARERMLRAAAAAAAAAAEAAATAGPPRTYDRPRGSSTGGGVSTNRITTARVGGGSGGGGGGGSGVEGREGDVGSDGTEESTDSLFDAPIRLMRR